MKTKVYKGKIRIGVYGANDEALFVGENTEPFTEVWNYDFTKRQQVSVKYWISETEKTREQLQENQLLSISGAAEADYGDRGSDITGYLWTDQDLKVGGHDLYQELVDEVGKFLFMEINYDG